MIYSSEGDLGDSLLAFSVASLIPNGPHTFLFRQSTVTKMRTPLDVSRWHSLIAPLFEAQDSVKECRIAKANEFADWDSGKFRAHGLHSVSQTLFQSHLNWLIQDKKIGHDFTSDAPWLTVEPSKKTEGRVVIARSERYRNPYFNWKAVVDKYQDNILFIGLPHEHAEFSATYGQVEHLPTKNYLEVAQAIKGSLLFIGNQSSPMAVAEGLKHPTIQETCLFVADCVYKRPNAQHIDNGAMTLPGLYGDGDTVVTPTLVIPIDPQTHTTPPGQWQWKHLKAYSLDQLKGLVKNQIPEDYSPDILEKIKRENVYRVPEFFLDDGSLRGFKITERARVNAGYEPRPFKEILGIES